MGHYVGSRGGQGGSIATDKMSSVLMGPDFYQYARREPKWRTFRCVAILGDIRPWAGL